MKGTRWISLLLIVAVSLVLLTGCKSEQEEDFSVDGMIDRAEQDQEVQDYEPDQTEEPSDETGEQEPEETPDQTKDPVEESPKEENPADSDRPAGGEEPKKEEPSDPADAPAENPQEQEWVKMEKEASGTALTMISQNVKHAGYAEYGERGDGTDNNIYNRLRRFKTLVTTWDPDVIYFNEAKITARNFFDEDPYMSQTYDYVWQDRHSTLEGHLMSEPVLWKTATFKTLETGHFWISPTPNREGPGFSGQQGADVSTWAKLQVKTTGEIVYVYCLHTYHGSDNLEACVGAMQLYYKRFEQMEKDAYAFVGGDYNASYRGTSYNGMIEWDKIVDLRDMAMFLRDDGLCELGGMNGTFNGTEFDADKIPAESDMGGKKQIDHITMKPHPNVCVDYYGVDYTLYDNKSERVAAGMVSDHWAVVVKLRIGTTPDYSQYQREQYTYENDQYYFAT